MEGRKGKKNRSEEGKIWRRGWEDIGKGRREENGTEEEEEEENIEYNICVMYNNIIYNNRIYT